MGIFFYLHPKVYKTIVDILEIEKGKPIARWGRKASGLRTKVLDSGVAGKRPCDEFLKIPSGGTMNSIFVVSVTLAALLALHLVISAFSSLHKNKLLLVVPRRRKTWLDRLWASARATRFRENRPMGCLGLMRSFREGLSQV